MDLLNLSAILMAFRLLPSGNGIPPFQAVTGANALIPVPAAPLPVDAEFLQRLQSLLDANTAQANATPPTPSPDHSTLRDASYVWLRTDRVRKPLEAPYSGPFKLLDLNRKTATILVNGQKQTVSVDRLKKAFVRTSVNPSLGTPSPLTSPSVPSSPPPVTEPPTFSPRTRTRKVRFAPRPDFVYF